MRSSQIVVLGLLVVIAPLGRAQRYSQTQAQQDGLAGNVKSVATIVDASDVRWDQPSGPTLLFPVVCRDCEYSPDGYRTRSGQVTDGKFVGELIALNRNPDGQVTEIVSTDASNGALNRRSLRGPAGTFEETFYRQNKVSARSTHRYDESGHMTESAAIDGSGAQIDRMRTTWTKDEWTERTVWGKNDTMLTRETYDPVKDEQHYTAFDDTGNVRLAWTFSHGKVASFWEPSNASTQPGDSFTDFNDKANPRAFHCHNNGSCDPAQVHYAYADPAKLNPSSAEWRDAGGNLLYGVYYTYTFDSAGNWTHREISVWNAELGARTPYETDDRLITYWK